MSHQQEAYADGVVSQWLLPSHGWSRLRIKFTRVFKRRKDPIVAGLERTIGLPVRNPALYKRAMRHRSVMRTQSEHSLDSNERLEFLGDAVLGLTVARYLYTAFPDRDEGFLTRIRSRLVNGEALADYARAIGLSSFIEMSENMSRTGGRDNTSILADAFEAVLGAIYLDHGLGSASRFVTDIVDALVDLDEITERRENFKSLLLELAQSKGWSQPRYQVVWERGPSHEREFCVEAIINDRARDRGTAKSKKRAEQLAASKTYRRLLAETDSSSD